MRFTQKALDRKLQNVKHFKSYCCARKGKEIKLEFDDNLTVDEMAERINNLLVISASVLILIKFSLIVGIINSLPRIPRIVQPRIPVEANRTSKLKIC